MQIQPTDNNKLQNIETEKYIGIPYVVNGRDFTGVDCYGLVRLIYKEELGIDLPSFVEEDVNPDRTQELISQYKEGWEQTEKISAGDVIVFRIKGIESHIAIAVSPTHFLHAREGSDSAIESFSSHKWKTRLVGSFKYSPAKSVVLNGLPHPLRTERITTAIPPGVNVIQLQDWIVKEYNVRPELKPYIKVLVNGVPIPDAMKESTILQDNDCVEYRVLARGDNPLRTLLTVAVVVGVAMATGPGGFAAGWGSSVGSALGIGTSAGTALVSIGLTAVGMSLVNAIAPVRMPSELLGRDPGSAERQLMVTGGNNQVTQYGSIPFVLGKVRLTPPLGANSYSLFNADGTESYLRMLLVWGYGPLSIDESTLKIGELNINKVGTYNVVTNLCTVGCTSHGLSAGTERLIQFTSGTATSGVYKILSTTTDSFTFNISAANTSGNCLVYHTYEGINQKTLSRIVEPTPTELSTFNGLYGKDVTQVISNIELSADGVAGSAITGPWINAVSTDGSASDFTVAIHFPQGCRKIISKGAEAGASAAAPVSIELEYKTLSAVTWISAGTTIIGSTPAKDAFTKIIKITYQASENVQVRVRRLTGTGNTAPADVDFQWLFNSVLLNTTFSRNASPAIDPVNCKIAKTAFEIKASDQLNSQIEGINAIVTSYGKIWNGTTWVDGATNNPASLFRLVLEHPANPRRITDAASKIDLIQLQYWYDYCVSKGFTYNSIVGATRSVLEVLRDICAAGRASPAMIDGKWTVVIDEPKLNVVQHFTPHNSWGFEGTKSLPKIPDGLRVNFINEDKSYQQDETIVYATASSQSSAALLENISVPGVTKLAQAQDHARWHMAQAKLRPEKYTLNTDIEYLVCNRGDRVKVLHDVPMWGLGSGRIKNIVGSIYYLDESIPMVANTSYTMRVRSKTGSSIVRTTVAKSSDGYYDNVEFTVPASTLEVDSGDLFLFGSLNSESQDCLVLNIEPMGNKTARLTLVDYGVTNIENIFTDYLNYTNTLAYSSNITKPPELLIQSFGTKVPTIRTIISDERMMERIAAGVFAYKMHISYTNDIDLPAKVNSVEFQWDYSTASDYSGTRSKQVPYNSGACLITGVEEGEVLKVRARYVGNDGRTGLWTTWVTHTIIGKTNPPASVTGFSITPDSVTGKLKLNWASNTEPDIRAYEVRTDTIWGNSTNLVFSGDSTTISVNPPSSGSSITYYIKAIDYSNNYSLTATSSLYTSAALSDITGITHNFYDTSTSSATITLSWTPVTQVFGLAGYEVSYGVETRFLDSNSILFNADWIGDRIFTVKTVDKNGNKSSGFSKTITKLLPNSPTVGNFLINQGTLVFDWDVAAKTTLPIWGYEVRATNTFNNDSNYIFKGSATVCTIPRSNIISGSNTYYIKTIDTDNNYSSTAASFTTIIAVPDNVTSVDSTFNTSLTSADITLTWVDVIPPFGLDYYEITYDSVIKTTRANTVTFPADWLGDRTFTVKVVDTLGYKSTGLQKVITKSPPNPCLNFRSQVIDNTVMFYWDLPTKTSLPVDHIILKKSVAGDGSTWATAITLGEKKGAFTTQNETRANTYTYWIAAVDTDNRESIPITITSTVAQPPDFVFNASYDSVFNATASSAIVEQGSLILPVNTTETWASHFTSRGWVGPEDPVGTAGQIDAGYPIFIQPTNGTGYYEEVFDYGSILASTKVSLTYNGSVISGSPVISTNISLSLDNITYTDYIGVSEVFSLSFRYVKVRFIVTESTGTGLYSLRTLNVTLDSKLINDAGSVLALASDTLGTIINFNKEFVDVSSVTLTPAGVTPIIPVYDIRGDNASATYSVTTNICTVTLTSHGYIAGQDVRLQFSTGAGKRGVYRILTSPTADTFTVSMITANTSGNCLVSANSFRAYLFNTSGARVSATASWQVKGY